MKIRQGFVSNSSTSSFIVYGVYLNELNLSDDKKVEMFDKWYTSLDSKSNWQAGLIKKFEFTNRDAKIEYVTDNLRDFLEDYSFECGGGYNYDEPAIGVSDELFRYPEVKCKDVKQAIADDLNAAFGTTFTAKDIKYIEQISYNG